MPFAEFSRYPIRFGLQTGVITAPQPSCLPLDETTFAEEMKSAGYSTHLVGKWHLGHYCPQCLPQNRGFDTFYGFLTGAEGYMNKTWCINIQDDGPQRCGFDFYDQYQSTRSANGTYSTFQFRDAVNRIIESSHKSRNPFFIYLPFQSVHGPLEVPKNYTTLYPS